MRPALWTSLILAPLLVGWLALEPQGAPDRVPLQGIWDRVDAAGGPPVQFYYFHPTDAGLFRFGSTDLNHTEMFRRRWRRDRLEIVFTKTGVRHRTAVRVTRDETGRRVLVLASDPRNGGRPTRYRRRVAPTARLRPPAPGASADPFARMWMHHRSLPHGRRDFRIYQLRPADRDGHGTGWFHIGDFDEWTTEALAYQRGPKGLHLRFVARDERAFTPVDVRASAGRRHLVLDRDPRFFGRPSAYADVGPNLMRAPPALGPGSLGSLSTETP